MSLITLKTQSFKPRDKNTSRLSGSFSQAKYASKLHCDDKGQMVLFVQENIIKLDPFFGVYILIRFSREYLNLIGSYHMHICIGNDFLYTYIMSKRKIYTYNIVSGISNCLEEFHLREFMETDYILCNRTRDEICVFCFREDEIFLACVINILTQESDTLWLNLGINIPLPEYGRDFNSAYRYKNEIFKFDDLNYFIDGIGMCNIEEKSVIPLHDTIKKLKKYNIFRGDDSFLYVEKILPSYEKRIFLYTPMQNRVVELENVNNLYNFTFCYKTGRYYGYKYIEDRVTCYVIKATPFSLVESSVITIQKNVKERKKNELSQMIRIPHLIDSVINVYK